MIYLIGGPARCGKTELSVRLMRRYGLPVASTDVYRAFMEELEQDSMRTPHMMTDDEYFEAVPRYERSRDRIRAHLPNLVWMLSGVYGDAVLEGVEIQPSDVEAIRKQREARAVFLIRTNFDAADLVSSTGRHDWLAGFGPRAKAHVAEEIGRLSDLYAVECQKLGITTVDVSARFEAGLAEAARSLGLPLA